MNVTATARNAIFAAITTLTAFTSPCPAQSNSSNFDSDNDSFSGNHLKIQTYLPGFTIANSPASSASTTYCAPKGAKFLVMYDANSGSPAAAGARLIVRFTSIPVTENNTDIGCTTNVVNTYTLYNLPDTALQTTPIKRSGVLPN